MKTILAIADNRLYVNNLLYIEKYQNDGVRIGTKEGHRYNLRYRSNQYDIYDCIGKNSIAIKTVPAALSLNDSGSLVLLNEVDEETLFGLSKIQYLKGMDMTLTDKGFSYDTAKRHTFHISINFNGEVSIYGDGEKLVNGSFQGITLPNCVLKIDSAAGMLKLFNHSDLRSPLMGVRMHVSDFLTTDELHFEIGDDDIKLMQSIKTVNLGDKRCLGKSKGHFWDTVLSSKETCSKKRDRFPFGSNGDPFDSYVKREDCREHYFHKTPQDLYITLITKRTPSGGGRDFGMLHSDCLCVPIIATDIDIVTRGYSDEPVTYIEIEGVRYYRLDFILENLNTRLAKGEEPKITMMTISTIVEKINRETGKTLHGYCFEGKYNLIFI